MNPQLAPPDHRLARRVRSRTLATVLVLLLQGGIQAVHANPRADSESVRSARGPAIEGVSGRLVRLFDEQARSLRSLSALADRHGLQVEGERILLDVVLHDDAADLRAEMAGAGGVVRSFSGRNGRASVAVHDRGALARIAALPGVQHVYPAYRPVRRVGAVTSRAVQALAVDTSPASGFTGAGQKIGILSDSFARTPDVVDGDTQTDGSPISASGNASPVTLTGSTPQDSLDLPAMVELRRDDATGSLSDEGAAMAELVHDLAPDAQLSFYSAFVSFGEFAAGLDDLCGPAAVDVVVDDILYLNELMYQRDVISRAAEGCVAGGVPHFSSAGNGGDRAFHRVYQDVDPNDNNDDGPAAVFGNDFHDWGASPGNGRLLQITLDPGEGFSAVLQWNQPALSTPENISNGPQVDLDLYLFSTTSNLGANIITSAIDDQRADSTSSGFDPFEIIQYTNATAGIQDVFLGIDHWAGSRGKIPQDAGTDLEFRLVFFETMNPAYDPLPADSTMYGHPVADGVISVGAVPWWEAPAFDPTLGDPAGIDPESFTAKGGRLQHHFRPDGSFHRRTLAPQPTLAAVDGNNTTFFGTDIAPIAGTEADTFPNFFGTSAAAPNAAAVAALLLEDDGTLVPADIAAKLMTSAIDVTGAEAAVGCDDRTGAGLIDAAAALPAADQAPVARAGDDQTTKSGRTVTLDGSTSSDNNAVQSFRWTQVQGPAVSLSNAGGAQTEFQAGAIGTLVFELRVTDAACLSDSDRITVTVKGGGGGGGGSLGLLFLGWLLLAARFQASARPMRREAA